MANTSNENPASTTASKPSSIPIPINRGRSASVASASSGLPDLSSSPSGSPPAPALRTPFPLSPTSPTLSKFLQTAPILSTSPSASRFAGYFGQSTSPVGDDNEDLDEFRARATGRRMSTGWAGRPFNPPVAGPPPAEQSTGLMRRFSLSGAFGRPFIAPPPTAPITGPTAAANNAMPTISEPVPRNPSPSIAPVLSPAPKAGKGRGLAPPRQPKRRSVSPMSERILKGQFDGFV